MMAMVVALVAGPTSSSTSAAPGSSPLAIRVAATGVAAAAQMYIGVPISSIRTDDTKPAGMTEPKKSSGTRMAISPDTSRPMTSHPVRSSSNGPKA